MTLTSHLESASLSQGELFLHVSATAAQAAMTLEQDGRTLPLERVEDGGSQPGLVPFRRRFSYATNGPMLLEYALDGGPLAPAVEAAINDLPDWSLENGCTLQMRLTERDQARLITLTDKVRIPASQEPRTFCAMIAAHRSDVVLILRFDPVQGGDPVTIEVPFDPQFTGGRDSTGYQQVAVTNPIPDRDTTLTLQIRYQGYRADAEDNFPYIFVAEAEITGPGGADALVQPRHRVLGPSDGGVWMRAAVPLFHGATDAPLLLRIGAETTPLFAPDQNSVTLIENYGHTLILCAKTPEQVLVFVDGKPVIRVHVGTEDTVVRLPLAYLRGEIIDVSIRDLSGTQVFAALPVLAPRSLTPHDVIVRETRAPFPTHLSARANHRYRALRAHLNAPIPDLDQTSLATAIDTLDQTHDTLKLRPIAFPKVKTPKVSIIIPAHNKLEVTYYALCALLVAHNHASFEVIVVDDASTDATATLETLVSGITVIRNAEPQRFIRACNAGVAKARGDYVVLLNNDTEPTVGWLDALIDAFARFPNVGLVGSKLLYPDGTLQDAGGIVWGNGNPWNYGNRANPWEPRFCYARQVDYLSGAALMTTRAIWDQVGGLSSYLEPMYFEDTDLAFKIRDAGYATWVVPSSIVYHFEGMTSGTDTTAGFKRHQEINRPKFKRKWARAFASFGKEAQNPDLEKDRGIIGRVLFIDYTTPRHDRDAGSYAAHREIELVQSLGYKVTFLPQNLAHFGSYTDDLERSGVEVITAPFWLSLQSYLEQHAADFDAVYITRYYVAQDTIKHIRAHAPQAKIILNNADLHFLRQLRSAISDKDPARLAAIRSVRDQELEMMTAADLVLSYNEVEHSVIASHTEGRARVMTCPWVIDTPATVPPLKPRQGLSFLGSFNHHPNAEGVAWFCQTVMPLLADTGANLTIYGSGMGPDIKALASDTIAPLGFIEDVADAYARHRVFVAPLLSGAGIKGKVLGALAHGIPCVLSPVAAEGVGLRHGHDCLIAETPQEWATAITRLLHDDALWRAMSEAARSYVSERFSPTAGRAKMKAAFEAVDLFGVE